MSGTSTSKPTKKKKKKRGFLLIFLITLCFIGAVISGGVFVARVLEYKKSDDEYKRIRNEVVTYTDSLSGDMKSVNGDGNNITPYENEDELWIPPIVVNFDKLKAINEDCVGWIYIEALDLSFPIMHGKTNNDYIYTSIEGNYSGDGSIFVEALNNGDFADPNTIVYGHTMMNGSMFAPIRRFFYNDAYEISPYFWILTPQGNYKYKIFSVHEADAYGDTYTLFYGTDKKFLDWCIKMRDESLVDCGSQDFTVDDHIVTLSCCSAKSGIRRVVQGICISDNIVKLSEDYEAGAEPIAREVTDPYFLEDSSGNE